MNKIVLAQIDTIAGDIEFNKNKIIDCIKNAKAKNADLIIFPNFVLTGFPYGDILKRHKSIIEKQSEALKEITDLTDNITIVIGFVDKCIDNAIAPCGRGLYEGFKNSILVIQQCKILNEKTFIINGEKYGILIDDNIETLINQKPDTIIHCDSSPSRTNKEYLLNEQFSSIAKKYGVNYIYVNKVGYSDNYAFNGTSKIYDKKGTLVLRAKTFEEDFIITSDLQGEINKLPAKMDKKTNFDDFSLDYKNDLDRTYKSIVFSIKQYFEKNGFKKAVLGLSGGLDSSVCAVLLADALGCENVWGISMPSRITSKESKNDAEILAKNLGINFLEVPIFPIVEQMKPLLNSAYENIKTDRCEKSTAVENLQARTRATILWSISNEYKQMLPISTSDKSEAYIGYATVNGDMSGGFAPIADITKTKLFALADFLNKTREIKNVIPKSVLEKPPGAELKINPKTGKPVYAEEDNMPYEFLDEIIWLVENKNIGKQELLEYKFLYEQKHTISKEIKEEWINKFYWKSKCAVYKWHILPASVIVDTHSINSIEYHQPIISKVYD